MYTTGSVIQFARCPGVVEFTSDTQKWTEDMVGYGIVVAWQGIDEQNNRSEMDTEVQPVVLDEGRPVCVDRYLADRYHPIQWRIIIP